MARGDKNLAGFGQVANINANAKQNDNLNTNDNINVNRVVDVNKDINASVDGNVNANKNVHSKSGGADYLDSILSNTKKEPALEMRGIYFEKDLLKVIDSLAKKDGSRGAKSKIVNAALRQVFTDKGLL